MYKVKVETIEQLNVALSSTLVSEIILARDSFSECDLKKYIGMIKDAGKISWIMLERVSRYEENMRNISLRTEKIYDLRKLTDKIYDIENIDGIIIQNIDSFAYMLRRINATKNSMIKIELNYTMNCYNSETKKVYESLYNEKRHNAKDVPLLFTAPIELNTYEIQEASCDKGFDTYVVYSYIDTMISANCIRKNLQHNDNVINNNIKNANAICKNRFDFDNASSYNSCIIDRKKKKVRYKTYCKFCYNKIYNTEPLYMIDKLEELNTKGTYRIDFSFETAKEVRDILEKKIPSSFTRGHYKNSIN